MTTETVDVVSQNLLHGIACPADSNRCKLPDRVALFARQLETKGCPEIVGIQEANADTVKLLRAQAKRICDGEYTVVWDGDPGVDREVVLTTNRVLGSRRVRLAGPLRTALWVRVDADVGIVDFVTTHLASSSDDRPCDEVMCPPPCRVKDRLNACQARQLVALAENVAHDRGVLIVTGDLNATTDEPAIAALRAAGLVDTHLAARNAECDDTSGDQCTSGRIDDGLADLTDPESRQSERIDYVFHGGKGRSCAVVKPTGLFNGRPGDGAAGLAFPADHTGVRATLTCRTTETHRSAVAGARVEPSATTTTTTTSVVDPQTLAAITDAYRAVFNGDVSDVEQKLAAVEDAELIREYFLQSYERSKEIATKIRVRLDEVRLLDTSLAEVTYTLLLEGAAVIDHQAGGAIKIDGRWLVTRRTYCEVSTQGSDDIPEPCRDLPRSRP